MDEYVGLGIGVGPAGQLARVGRARLRTEKHRARIVGLFFQLVPEADPEHDDKAREFP